jgi:hypothetical protein
MGLKKGNILQVKAASAAYTDTTEKALFTLPSQAMIVNVTTNGVLSNAATTGVLTLFAQPTDGSTSAATFAVLDVKGGTAGQNTNAVLSGVALNQLSKGHKITAIYTETGTAANAGAWTVLVDFM